MQENDTRPDPEVLLARLKEEEQEEGGRGKLRIYLGYAAGVGKTYTCCRPPMRLRTAEKTWQQVT